MNLKDIFSNLKKVVLNVKNYSEQTVENEKNVKSEEKVEELKKIYPEDIGLSKQIDNIVDFYFSSLPERNRTSSDEKNLRDFIEKMAVWYELRYPDYEIERLIPRVKTIKSNIISVSDSNDEDKYVSDEMFLENQYMQDLDDDAKCLEWSDFYNASAFIKSLPDSERKYLAKPRYTKLVYPDNLVSKAHLHLNANGKVIDSTGMKTYTNNKVKDKSLIGMPLVDVVKLLKSKGIELPDYNDFDTAINEFSNKKTRKDILLDAVMYRIIERGNKCFGPSRGLLYAKEFGRNIDIPMMYGINVPGDVVNLLNEYIKAGGKKDTLCYKTYFNFDTGREEVTTVTVGELLKKYEPTFDEEGIPQELYQRMVNALNNSIDPEKLKKEEIRKLRLKRKLANSRRKEN